MEEYYKSGHEKLRQLVYLHHDTIIHLIQLLKNKEKKEANVWDNIQKDLKKAK